MKLEKTDIKVVSDFLTNVKESGTVCRQDILSLEEKVEGVVSDSINVNYFTSIPTSTNVDRLTTTLESIIALNVEEEEKPVTIDVLLENIKRFKSKLKQRISFIEGSHEYDPVLIDNIINNCFLSRFEDNGDGDKVVVDITESNVETLETEINYIIDMLTANLDDVSKRNVHELGHSIGACLYNKPSNVFSILRIALNNPVTIEMEQNDISNVTIKELIKDFVIENKLRIKLLDLHKSITHLQTSLLFDDKYDNNQTTETVFSYTYLNKKITNLEGLIDDEVSFYIIRVFQQLLSSVR